jgi:hypothetical protein
MAEKHIANRNGRTPAPSEVPQFEPSPHWGRPPIPSPSPSFAPVAPEVYEEVLAGMARFVGEVDELFRLHRPGINNMAGFASLYLGPSGRFFLLRPHSHLEVAGKIMRSLHPHVPPPGCRRSKGGGWSHSDLSLVSAIQRLQIYGDGIGVTVNMDNPPNQMQLDAIRSAYLRTPMGRFAAEIDHDGRTLITLGSFAELVRFVGCWDPERSDEVLRISPKLAGLYASPEAQA